MTCRGGQQWISVALTNPYQGTSHPHLGWYRMVYTAEFLERRVPVISAGGEDGHHQLKVGTDLRPNGIQVRLSAIVGQLNHLGIVHLTRVCVCV